MTWTLLALLLHLVSFLCYVLVLVHAFQRSVGTGVMVLCIPCYNIYYAFSQFEHPRKGLIVAGWLSTFVLGAVLRAVGMQLQ